MDATTDIDRLSILELEQARATDERIRQLDALVANLSNEIDRQRPVVEAAQVLARSLRRHSPASWNGSEETLERAVTTYEASSPK